MQVKSFGYTIRELEVRADSNGVDLTYYSPSGEWNLLDTWTEEVDNLNYSQVRPLVSIDQGCFKGNIGETPERRGGAHNMGLPERIDTIFN